MMEPSNVKELRSYLGCFGYYRKFVSNFSQIAEPLYSLLRKGTKFVWSSKQQMAFDTLKIRLASAPVLALPIDNAQIIVDCDDSDTGLGAVLSMIIEDEEKPISYASRMYNKQETNWCITRRELFSTIFALKQFRQYCLGRKILVRTDHAPLINIQSTPTPSSQICRWLDFLAENEMEIQHRPGIRHGNADGCSRTSSACKQCKLSAESYVILDEEIKSNKQKVQRTEPGKVTEETNVQILTESPTSKGNENITEAALRVENPTATMDNRCRASTSSLPVDWAHEQQEDTVIRSVYKAFLESSEAPEWSSTYAESEDTKNLLVQWPLLTLKDRVLYRKWLDARTHTTKWLQRLIPASEKDNVLQLAHTGMSGGHLGVRKTTAQVQRRAYWKAWRTDVAKFVQSCQHCATYRRSKPPRLGELQDMNVGSPMERAGIYLTGPWSKSEGKVYILTFIDHFTKWADAVPIPNKEAETVARALVSRIFTQVGCPLQLLSDQGKEFDCHLIKDLCITLGIDKIRASPYKASTNATAERLHRTINAMCAKMVDANQKNWTEVLPHVMAAYRSAVHESTGYSPNFLFFGRACSNRSRNSATSGRLIH
jgi:transposase InsO family protein